MPEHQQPTPEQNSIEADPVFETAKQRYFVSLALELRPALEAHRAEGMLDRDENKERPWGNVTEHCLVEAARVRELAELLGLSEDVASDLMLAAGVHDFYKKSEKDIAAAAGGSWEGYEEASRQSKQKMEEAGLSPRVIRLANSVGHGSLLEADALLSRPELSQDEIAFLAMHYVDDYTSGTDWVSAEGDPLRERVQKNAANPRYHALDEAGREHFGGILMTDKQLEVGEKIAARLSVIAERNGNTISPQKLPLAVDQKVRERIQSA